MGILANSNSKPLPSIKTLRTSLCSWSCLYKFRHFLEKRNRSLIDMELSYEKQRDYQTIHWEREHIVWKTKGQIKIEVPEKKLCWPTFQV